MLHQYYILNSIFEQRNRLYGAYPLRVFYHQRLLKSMFLVLGFFALSLYALQYFFNQNISLITSETSVQKKESGIIVIFDEPYIIEKEEKPFASSEETNTSTITDKIGPDKVQSLKPVDFKNKNAGPNDDNKNNGKPSSTLGIPKGLFKFQNFQKPTVESKPDIPARYKNDLNEFLDHQLETYPIENIGVVQLSFIIEKDGSLSHIKVVESLDETTDLRVMDIIQSISNPGNWIPAQKDGSAVRSLVILPINFSEGLKGKMN